MARYTGPATRKSRRLKVDLMAATSPSSAARTRRASTAESASRSPSTCCSCRRSRRRATPTACSRSRCATTTRRRTVARARPATSSSLLESRLDSVVYRAGLAQTRRQARQLVGHGHFLVNGQKVDVPSYRVTPYDIIEVKAKSVNTTPFIIAQGELRRPARPGLAAGRSRPAAHLRPLPPGADADRHAGLGAADRRVLLEVSSAAAPPPWPARRPSARAGSHVRRQIADAASERFRTC